MNHKRSIFIKTILLNLPPNTNLTRYSLAREG